MDHIDADTDDQQADCAARQNIHQMLPACSGTEGMEHTGLKGENGKKRLCQAQHPDGRVYGTGMLPIFRYVQKAVGDFIKGKSRSGDDLNLP